jgi:hypothetical protein
MGGGLKQIPAFATIFLIPLAEKCVFDQVANRILKATIVLN